MGLERDQASARMLYFELSVGAIFTAFEFIGNVILVILERSKSREQLSWPHRKSSD